MKRIHLYYQGVRYTVADRELDDLKNEIATALASHIPYWLTVNHGEGTLRETELLVAPGVGIALIPIDPTTEESLPAVGVALPGEGI